MTYLSIQKGILTEQDPENQRHRFLWDDNSVGLKFACLLDLCDWIEERMETTPWLSNKEGVTINLNEV